jgi:hypothetical protein
LVHKGTKVPQAVQIYLDEDEENSVTLVDTPGFDDTYREDGEILAEITSFLATQYAAEVPLYGIIYLHMINENRMRGTSRKYLEIFRSLCGDDALKHVVLVTTGWESIPESGLQEALSREQELVNKFWARMIEKGSYYTKFDGSQESAEGLILELIESRTNVVLDIQRELVDQDKPVRDSAAGRGLGTQIERDLKSYREQRDMLEARLGIATDEKDKKEIDSLRRDLTEISGIIKRLEKSDRKLRDRVGREAKGKVDAIKKRKRDHVLVTAGIPLLTAALGVALTVVKFVVLGGF